MWWTSESRKTFWNESSPYRYADHQKVIRDFLEKFESDLVRANKKKAWSARSDHVCYLTSGLSYWSSVLKNASHTGKRIEFPVPSTDVYVRLQNRQMRRMFTGGGPSSSASSGFLWLSLASCAAFCAPWPKAYRQGERSEMGQAKVHVRAPEGLQSTSEDIVEVDAYCANH